VVIDMGPIRSGRVEASIKNGRNNEKIGTVTARIVQRNKQFHRKCDELSQDLQTIGCAMFDPDGSPRCRELTIDDHMKVLPKTRKGAFLYIEELNLKDAFKVSGASDVGADAIQGFLDRLEGKWTVAVYIGDYLEAITSEERERAKYASKDSFHARMAGVRDEPDDAFEEELKVNKGISSDLRQFVRNGFKELSEETTSKIGWMFITEDMRRQWKLQPDKMQHAEALKVTLRADAPLDRETFRHSAKDDELREHLLTKVGEALENMGPTSIPQGIPLGLTAMLGPRTTISIASIMERADQLVANGADFNRANALHACVAKGFTQLFEPLVHRGALVNAKGQNDDTPLMAAVSSATPRADVIRALLDLGADKNITDGAGRTALGCFYIAGRASNDFRSCFGLGGNIGPDPTMERLLMPSGGATAADKRCKRK
jgi:hypothetical protein